MQTAHDSTEDIALKILQSGVSPSVSTVPTDEPSGPSPAEERRNTPSRRPRQGRRPGMLTRLFSSLKDLLRQPVPPVFTPGPTPTREKNQSILNGSQ